VETDAGLDLDVVGAISRADFDTCAGTPGRSHQRQPFEGCSWLPIGRGDGGYFFQQLENVGRYGLSGATQWPLDAGQLQLAFALSPTIEGPLAAPTWRLLANDPRSVPVEDWMSEVDKAFTEWSEPASAGVIASRPGDLTAPLAAVTDEYLLRKRLRLLSKAATNTNGCCAPDGLHTELFEDYEHMRFPNSGPPPPPPPLFKVAPGPATRQQLEKTYDAIRAEPKRSTELFKVACSGARGELKAVCALLVDPPPPR
jgi:hypothetical protein